MDTQIAFNAAVELRRKKHELRAMKKHLRDLSAVVGQCVTALDAEMKQPSTVARGSRIANITNALQLQNDIARRFGLGVR